MPKKNKELSELELKAIQRATELSTNEDKMIKELHKNLNT